MIILTTINPQDFFTPGSFATLAGATGIVYIICGAVQSVFNFSPKWFALLISIGVSFIGASLNVEVPVVKSGEPVQHVPTVLKYFIALLNGFLIFSSATGSNQLLARGQQPAADGPRPPGVAPLPGIEKRQFNSRW